VDVVITKWEIVYFDGSGVEAPYGRGYTEEDIKNIESVRQAVIATKGGKGLRLRDVATGRKVVGHLALSTIDSIYVDRIMPPESHTQSKEPESNAENEVQVEFWKSSTKSTSGESRLSREEGWSKVKQDRLRVQSVFGTLLLRYYSDLEDSEFHQDRDANEREVDGHLFKDNAFQWCQTICRLCGVHQLKQKLPNFGKDNDAELRDYFVVVDSKTHQDNPRHMRRKSLGNMLTSVKDHTNLWAMINEHDSDDDPPDSATRPGRAQRLSSFEGGARSSRRSLRGLRRLSSTGDLPSMQEHSSTSLECPSQSRLHPTSDHVSGADKGADMV
jgi:hypothetical protein